MPEGMAFSISCRFLLRAIYSSTPKNLETINLCRTMNIRKEIAQIGHWNEKNAYIAVFRDQSGQTFLTLHIPADEYRWRLTVLPASLLCKLTKVRKSRPFSPASTNFLENWSAKWMLSLHPPHCHPALLTPLYLLSQPQADSFPPLQALAMACDTPAAVTE